MKVAKKPKNLIHEELKTWVEEVASLCKPDQVYWCDGSQAEYDDLCEQLVEKGTFIRLNPKKRPNSFACFSDPSDVARVEDKTYICSRVEEDAPCVRLRAKGDTLTLLFPPEWLDRHPLTAADLELEQQALANAGYTLTIREAGTPGA